jgi:aminomethyltransferase
MEAGRPHDIRPTGPVDIRRVEGGIFNWGCDFDYRNDPYEMGMERLVDLEMEADFMGKEALRRISREGVRQRIIGVEIEGEPLEMNAVPWPVSVDGAAPTEGAGDEQLYGARPSGPRVTSALWSPRLKRNIGYAWLPVASSAQGTRITVDTDNGSRQATVVPIPFVDPGKLIPKS